MNRKFLKLSNKKTAAGKQPFFYILRCVQIFLKIYKQFFDVGDAAEDALAVAERTVFEFQKF